MNDNLKIILKAMLDKSNFSDIKKQLAKQKFNVTVDIPTDKIDKSLSDIKKHTSGVEKNFQKLLDYSALEQQTEKLFLKFNQILSAVKAISDVFENISNSQSEELSISLGDTISELGNVLTESEDIQNVISFAIKMADQVYEIDTAMTNLCRSTREADAAYDNFLSSANQSAQELGSSVMTIIEQTSKWAEQGYNLKDSGELAKTSSIYSNISGVDDDTAISDISAAMEAFNIEAADSISIIDKLSRLGGEFSVSSGELGTGLSVAASDLQSAGNDIDEALAMIAGGSAVIGDISDTDDFLKIFSLRIRGMRDQLKELGEDYTDVYSQSGMRSRISSLTNGSVDIFDASGNLKSGYEILQDVSDIYNRLSDTKQTNLLQTLFGEQRSSQGASIIKAFQSGEIENAYKASVNSAGSAYEEQSKWLDTLESKTKQFEAAFQSLSQTMINSDMLKLFVDFGTGAVNAVDSVAKAFGTLPVIMAGAGAVLGAKNLGRLKVSLNIYC